MPIYSKVSGTWQQVKSPHVKVAGSWRRLRKAFVKVSGVWRQIHSEGFDISKMSYKGAYDDYNNATTDGGATYSSQGLKMIQYASGIIYGYNLSSNEDITTLGYAGQSRNTDAIYPAERNIRGIDVSSDGTKLYHADIGQNRIYQRSMTTPFNVATLQSTGINFDYSVVSPYSPGQIKMSWDGKNLFGVRSSNKTQMHRSILSTAWDISSITGIHQEFICDYDIEGIAFSYDGRRMIVAAMGTFSVGVFGACYLIQYDLPGPYDISNPVQSHIMRIDQIMPEIGLYGADIQFNEYGTKLYISTHLSTRVYQLEQD